MNLLEQSLLPTSTTASNLEDPALERPSRQPSQYQQPPSRPNQGQLRSTQSFQPPFFPTVPATTLSSTAQYSVIPTPFFPFVPATTLSSTLERNNHKHRLASPTAPERASPSMVHTMEDTMQSQKSGRVSSGPPPPQAIRVHRPISATRKQNSYSEH